jgi:hypothetical protein
VSLSGLAFAFHGKEVELLNLIQWVSQVVVLSFLYLIVISFLPGVASHRYLMLLLTLWYALFLTAVLRKDKHLSMPASSELRCRCTNPVLREDFLTSCYF